MTGSLRVVANPTRVGAGAVRTRPWEVFLYAGVAILFFSHFTDWRGFDDVCVLRGFDPGTWFLGHLALVVALIAYAYVWSPERSGRSTSLLLAGWSLAGGFITRVYWMPRTAGPWMAALGWLAILVCAVWALFVPRAEDIVIAGRKGERGRRTNER